MIPLAPQRYALQVTVAQETFDKIERARDLLRHQVPGGELEQVLDRALEALICRLEKRKCAATEKPRAAKPQPNANANPRHIPAAVRRAVWQRDRGQCTFRSDQGRRCEARDRLEFDHELPVARGGGSTAGNFRLRCRAHNQLEAERAYGAGFMRNKRKAVRDLKPGSRRRTDEHAAGTARRLQGADGQQPPAGARMPRAESSAYRPSESARSRALRASSRDFW